MRENAYSPSDAATWHNRFTKDELQWNDLSRSGKIVVPVILLFFIIIIYLILYVSFRSAGMEKLNVSDRKWFLVKLVFSIVIPVLIAGIGIRILGGQSDSLVRKFYRLPDNYDLAPLVKRKLLGVLPLPEPLKKLLKYPFITLK